MVSRKDQKRLEELRRRKKKPRTTTRSGLSNSRCLAPDARCRYRESQILFVDAIGAEGIRIELGRGPKRSA